MAIQPGASIPRAPRRFARLPHDSQTERIAQAWAVDVSPTKAFELILPELTRGSFLASTLYKERCCASLTRGGDDCTQMCNAVSGWGNSPVEAIIDLAFRWCVLCKESWMVAEHVPLVSEVRR